MAITASRPHDYVWRPLRQAITESSGFQAWLQAEKLTETEANVDELVHRYLQETLSTLAY